jgi:ADP-ribose pyrophosphatase YjhB (NUDIX family)
VSRRIDYYDDPAAPAANSLAPSVNVVVVNGAGEVLLIRRSDNDNWAVPGGAIDLGESMVQAAVRETREEAGIECEVTGLVGIYTDPRQLDVAQVTGAVQAVQAGRCQLGEVADVVQPGGGLQHPGVLPEGGREVARPGGETLDVRPAAGQRLFQQGPGEALGPPGQRRLHGLQARRAPGDMHGRGLPSADV